MPGEPCGQPGMLEDDTSSNVDLPEPPGIVLALAGEVFDPEPVARYYGQEQPGRLG